MDLEQTMAFIVEQQAKFETDIAKINETSTRINETSRIHAEAIHDLVEVSRLHSERIDRLDQSMAESYNRLARAQEETAESYNRLARAQEETDRRLKDFIAQVARYLAEGNGRKRRPDGPRSK